MYSDRAGGRGGGGRANEHGGGRGDRERRLEIGGGADEAPPAAVRAPILSGQKESSSASLPRTGFAALYSTADARG